MSATTAVTTEQTSTTVVDVVAPSDVPSVEATSTTTTTADEAPAKEARKTKSGGGGKCFEKASVMGLIRSINDDRIAKFMREQWPALAIQYCDTFAKEDLAIKYMASVFLKDEANKNLSDDEKKAAVDAFVENLSKTPLTDEERKKALDGYVEEKKSKEIEAIKFRLSNGVHAILEAWVKQNLKSLEEINYFEIPTSHPQLNLKKVYFHRPEFKNFRKHRVETIKANTERVIRYALLSAAQMTATYKKITIGKTEITLVLGMITKLVFHAERPPVVETPAAQELMDTSAPSKKTASPVKKAVKRIGGPSKKAPKDAGSAPAAKKAKPAVAVKKSGKKAAGPASKKQKTAAAGKKSKAVNVVVSA